MLKNVNVDLLTGRALVWAAIVAMNHQPHITPKEVGYRTDHGSWDFPRVSEQEAVELMTEHWIGVERPSRGQTPPQWRALVDYVGPRKGGQLVNLVCSAYSPDLAVAVYRAFIKSRLGEVVGIPSELADELVNEPQEA